MKYAPTDGEEKKKHGRESFIQLFSLLLRQGLHGNLLTHPPNLFLHPISSQKRNDELSQQIELCEGSAPQHAAPGAGDGRRNSWVAESK